MHPKLDKAWSEVLRSDEDPPRTRELTRARMQPDRHRDLPLFAARAPERELDLGTDDGPPLPDNDPMVQFPGGVSV